MYGLPLVAALAGCHAAPSAAPATMINASVRASYLAGVFDGFISVGALRARGDFGFAAADRNGGEITVIDGVYYNARHDGSVVPLTDDTLLPFATITAFRPDRQLHITGPLTRAEFEAKLDSWLPGTNRIFAIRVHGRFSHVVAGASVPQSKPYRKFAEIYPEYNLIAHDDLVGTLAGFRVPAVLRDITRQGYHFHLLSDDKRAGGHVDDEAIGEVDVEAQELHGIDIVMPDSPEFAAAPLILLGDAPK